MKHSISLIAIALTLSFLMGCATSAAPLSAGSLPDAQRIYWSDTGENSFTLRVTRDRGQMGSLCMTRIAIDDERAADIYQGESVIFKVPEGNHVLSAWQQTTGKMGSGICTKVPFRKDMRISGDAGESLAFRYSYAVSGEPSLIISSVPSP